jgi:hypothetical protein
VVVNEQTLGQRLTETERRTVLDSLQEICRQHGVALLIIHPSYATSLPHECVMTHVCSERKVSMMDARPVLHPTDSPPDEALHLDLWHPHAEGHHLRKAEKPRWNATSGRVSSCCNMDIRVFNNHISDDPENMTTPYQDSTRFSIKSFPRSSNHITLTTPCVFCICNYIFFRSSSSLAPLQNSPKDRDWVDFS